MLLDLVKLDPIQWMLRNEGLKRQLDYDVEVFAGDPTIKNLQTVSASMWAYRKWQENRPGEPFEDKSLQ